MLETAENVTFLFRCAVYLHSMESVECSDDREHENEPFGFKFRNLIHNFPNKIKISKIPIRMCLTLWH